ncbi:hypothetical protein QTN25_006644 [Entamoeba marina]
MKPFNKSNQNSHENSLSEQDSDLPNNEENQIKKDEKQLLNTVDKLTPHRVSKQPKELKKQEQSKPKTNKQTTLQHQDKLTTIEQYLKRKRLLLHYRIEYLKRMKQSPSTKSDKSLFSNPFQNHSNPHNINKNVKFVSSPFLFPLIPSLPKHFASIDHPNSNNTSPKSSSYIPHISSNDHKDSIIHHFRSLFDRPHIYEHTHNTNCSLLLFLLNQNGYIRFSKKSVKHNMLIIEELEINDQVYSEHDLIDIGIEYLNKRKRYDNFNLVLKKKRNNELFAGVASLLEQFDYSFDFEFYGGLLLINKVDYMDVSYNKRMLMSIGRKFKRTMHQRFGDN